MQKITTFLWFDTQAEEAAQFYVSLFKNSRILSVTRFPEGAPGPAGKVITVSFELDGQQYTALNGGPQFKFTEAISLVVNCESQAEIDNYWKKLTANGGSPQRCGWLKDRYGLSWQIVPTILGRLMSDPDGGKSGRVMQALLAMDKIDIGTLQAACDGTAAGARA